MNIWICVMLGLALIIMIVAILTVIINKYAKYYTKKLDKYPRIFLGKISDNQDDDISKAIPYLKLTNSLKDRR